MHTVLPLPAALGSYDQHYVDDSAYHPHMHSLSVSSSGPGEIYLVSVVGLASASSMSSSKLMQPVGPPGLDTDSFLLLSLHFIISDQLLHWPYFLSSWLRCSGSMFSRLGPPGHWTLVLGPRSHLHYSPPSCSSVEGEGPSSAS